MKQEDFIPFCDKLLSEARDILNKKGKDYSGYDDRLLNFKRIANTSGADAQLVWLIYMTKHYDAIATWSITKTLASEDLRGRFIDLINYCLLGAALAEELR